MEYPWTTKNMSQEECAKTGGHDWVANGVTILSYPPDFKGEICRKCGEER